MSEARPVCESCGEPLRLPWLSRTLVCGPCWRQQEKIEDWAARLPPLTVKP